MNLLSIFSRLGIGKKQPVVNLQQEESSQLSAAMLPPQPPPKAPSGPQSFPGYRTAVTAKTSRIAKDSTLQSSLDRIADIRDLSSDYTTLRAMLKYSPEFSSATSHSLRVGIPETYTLIGKNMDGQVDPNATQVAHELLRRLTFMGAADGSFGAQMGLQSLSETLAIDMELTGAMALEVALDKQRIPASFNPIAVKTIFFYEEDNSFRAVQKIGGEEIDLDIPTFIYVAKDQVVTEAYSTSPLSAAIQPVIADLEFNNDTRKALKRAVLPRLQTSIDSEKFRKNTPPEIIADAEAYIAYQNEAISAIETVINGLSPEDALINFDFISHSFIDGGKDPAEIIERVQNVLNAKLVAGMKTMPVTLGFASTSNASSSESLLFVKHCDGIRRKLNEIYSRALTVAIRLMGVEGYVEFIYDHINLKPEEELEAFKVMKQSRILELLSIGLMSDEEASIRLTGHLPPPGATKLSGTMFMSTTSSSDAVATATTASSTNTSNTANATERTTKPSTPTQPKS